MTEEVISGFVFHGHHDKLTEFCTNYKDRVDYIQKWKSAEEVALRLRLFKLIPVNRLPYELVEAMESYVKARRAYDEAMKAYTKARKTYFKARKAHSEAWKVYAETWKAHVPYFTELHKELCPDCPFNGTTIFTRKDSEGKWY